MKQVDLDELEKGVDRAIMAVESALKYTKAKFEIRNMEEALRYNKMTKEVIQELRLAREVVEAAKEFRKVAGPLITWTEHRQIDNLDEALTVYEQLQEKG